MNKLFAILLSAALLLTVLAGCQSSEQPPVTTQPQAAPQETTAPQQETTPMETVPATEPAAQYITPEEAKAIALQDAGLTEDKIYDLDIDLDRDGGAVHYDVDFEKDGADYDYDIDAVTGQILRVEKPQAAAPASTTPSSSSSTSSSSSQLTKNEARDIALKHAGVKASEVRDLEVELDRDDGTLHYDVDFEKDGYEYDYEIDAATGKILKSRKERD